MPRAPEAWVFVRRHPKGRGLYVYLDAETLAKARVPEDAEVFVVRRYVLGKGDILVRFRAMDEAKALREGWKERKANKAEGEVEVGGVVYRNIGAYIDQGT